jgi:hypothetical protein
VISPIAAGATGALDRRLTVAQSSVHWVHGVISSPLRLDDDKYPIAAQPGMRTLITDDASRGLVADNSIECGAF